MCLRTVELSLHEIAPKVYKEQYLEKENDILERTLALAETGYSEAYRFLSDFYGKNSEQCGPQTLYFLACLAGGMKLPDEALDWLRKSIRENGWWYRPEVLIDDDLEPLYGNAEFIELRSLSDARYAEAVKTSKSLLSWQEKTAGNLFIAVHGNTQNGQTARNDWAPIVGEAPDWQLETIQSGEPDGYGTYRWSYDMTSYLPVANAMTELRDKGYLKIVCGGFSAGCDMLLRAVAFTPARCDLLVLQSPWIPLIEDHADDLIRTIREKNIVVRILCGAEDEDCLDPAERLQALLEREKLDVRLTVQPNSRHQFPPAETMRGNLLDIWADGIPKENSR